MTSERFPAVIIGAGPAGLMAAEVLSQAGVEVHIFDSMPSAGRKLLVAGKGGLNLTRAEPFESFLDHYVDHRDVLSEWLCAFGPDEVQAWARGLGIQTFIGTSRRVFPIGMKAAPLLRAWLDRLKQSGVVFHFKHKWTGWDPDGSLFFDSPSGRMTVQAKAVLLALGGASWPITGSTGAWVPLLQERSIPVAPLKPSNCGFNVAWTDHFRKNFAGAPVKTVVASFTDSRGRSFRQQGEFVITQTGVEGNLIYACSALLRNEIEAQGQAILHLDLLPNFTLEQAIAKLSRPREKRSLSSHLEKTLGIKGVKAGLLQEVLHAPPTATDSDVFAQHRIPHSLRDPLGARRRAARATDPASLANLLKDLPLTLLAPRPIEEAISSAGGVQFDALNDHLMLKSLPGLFCAGEMLDWEAPTGGYLLTACLASGRLAARGMLKWLEAS